MLSPSSVDALRGFRQDDQCTVNSFDLYRATNARKCPDRQRLLTAMSGGGRIGLNAPYQSRDCGTSTIAFLALHFRGARSDQVR